MAAARTIATVYLAAVAINYPWELAQAPLFTAESHAGSTLLHCFIASLGDGLMLLLLMAIGWLAQGRADWFTRPGPRGYITLIVSGALLGLAVESVAVHVLQRWSYSDSMPLVPLVNVGVIPVLQMILLPPLIFFLVARMVMRS